MYDKLKTLNLHYHNGYDHHTRQDGEIQQVTPTHKAAWSFDNVFL